MGEIRENLLNIRSNIAEVCAKLGRNPDDICLIAVTKTVDVDRINHCIECGARDIGENKVQEIMDKYEKISKDVKWHLIGHLQSNKVKYIIDKVDLIHSVDSISLAQEINSRAEKNALIKEVLVQVNVADEESKFGIEYDRTESFVREISQLGNIRVKGLMTIAPLFEDVENARPVFRALKQKFDELNIMKIPDVEMKYLSMGMTNDYRIAIEEGSNMVRVGTGIFGKRNYNK